MSGAWHIATRKLVQCGGTTGCTDRLYRAVSKQAAHCATQRSRHCFVAHPAHSIAHQCYSQCKQLARHITRQLATAWLPPASLLAATDRLLLHQPTPATALPSSQLLLAATHPDCWLAPRCFLTQLAAAPAPLRQQQLAVPPAVPRPAAAPPAVPQRPGRQRQPLVAPSRGAGASKAGSEGWCCTAGPPAQRTQGRQPPPAGSAGEKDVAREGGGVRTPQCQQLSSVDCMRAHGSQLYE